MKKFFAVCISLLMLIVVAVPCYAAPQREIVSETTTTLANGIECTTTIYWEASSTRASTRNGGVDQSYSYGGNNRNSASDRQLYLQRHHRNGDQRQRGTFSRVRLVVQRPVHLVQRRDRPSDRHRFRPGQLPGQSLTHLFAQRHAFLRHSLLSLITQTPAGGNFPPAGVCCVRAAFYSAANQPQPAHRAGTQASGSVRVPSTRSSRCRW